MNTERLEQTGANEFMTSESVVCPVCGLRNSGDAAFCANPGCGKALGPFPFVREELAAEAKWYEVLADKITAVIGAPHFLVIHALWFVLWVIFNSGMILLFKPFDEYPYSLLGIILAVEAIFITGFVLISQNRQSTFADKRAELDYEVNVRTYREIHQLKIMLQTIHEQLERAETDSTSAAASSISNMVNFKP
jgi:uncharacterized membrane protein